MVNFAEIIEGSLEWTAAVLFRPFNFKKWLSLIFVGLMAGYLSGGCNLSLNNSRKIEGKKTDAVQVDKLSVGSSAKKEIRSAALPSFHEVKQYVSNKLKSPLILTLVIFAMLLIISLFILFVWLSARFNFIFLETIINNDAAIVRPFKTHKEIGNSLFRFSLFFLIFSISILGFIIFRLIKALILLGVFSGTAKFAVVKILLVFLYYGTMLLLWFVIVGIISYLFVRDFIMPLMFRDRIKFIPACLKFAAIFKAHKKEFLLFWLIRIALSFCCLVTSSIIYLLACIAIIMPGIAIALILAVPSYFLYKIMPLLCFIILFVLVVPLVLFIGYCFAGISLPFAVFLRTLSLKFLARIDSNYNFFRHQL